MGDCSQDMYVPPKNHVFYDIAYDVCEENRVEEIFCSVP